MRHRTRHATTKGFALMVVMMVVALMSVGALALLNQTTRDTVLLGRSRQLWDAASIADGAVMEVVNDERTGAMLPDYGTTNLVATWTQPTASPWVKASQSVGYDAEVRLLRFVPISETSENWSRALVYEVSAAAFVDHERTTSEVRAEIFRPITVPAGTLLPRRHAR